MCYHISQDVRMTVFRAFILNNCRYCSAIWHHCSLSNTQNSKLRKGLCVSHRRLSVRLHIFVVSEQLAWSTNSHSTLQNYKKNFAKFIPFLAQKIWNNLSEEIHTLSDLPFSRKAIATDLYTTID